MQKLIDALENIPDHRKGQGKEYKLSSLLSLVLVGFLCGCDSLAAVHRFAKNLDRKQREALGFLWFKVPSHPAICVTFQGLNIEAFEEVLRNFLFENNDLNEPLHLMIDGKQLRGSKTKELPRGAQMISCFCDKIQAVIGQETSRGGYDEVNAAIKILQQISLKNMVITGDAMFADKKLCSTIVAGGGNYVFPVKNNQPSLKQAISSSLEQKKLDN